jgi:hypothetical protein
LIHVARAGQEAEEQEQDAALLETQHLEREHRLAAMASEGASMAERVARAFELGMEPINFSWRELRSGARSYQTIRYALLRSTPDPVQKEGSGSR